MVIIVAFFYFLYYYNSKEVFMSVTYKGNKEVLYETCNYEILFQDEKGSNSIRHLYVKRKDDGKEFFIGKYFMNNVSGAKEWCVYNDNAIAILSNDIYIPRPEPIVKVLVYLPTLTFINGSPQQLRDLFKMLVPPKENDKKTEPSKILLKNKFSY